MTEENPEEELFSDPKHRIRELEQEVEIMGEYISIMSDKEMDQKQPESSQHTSDLAIHKQRESEQEKLILNELGKALEEKTELDKVSHQPRHLWPVCHHPPVCRCQ